MAVRKIKTKNGQTRWEVYLSSCGRSSKCLRRRFKKKIDAEEFVTNFGQTISRQALSENVLNPKVDDFKFKNEARYWLDIQKPSFSLKNFNRCSDIMEKLIPLIGEVALVEFKPSLLYRIRNELIEKHLKGKNGKTISNAAVNRWLSLITSVINFSVNQQRCPFNPSLGFQKLREIRKGIDFWSLDESKVFLRFIDQKYPKGSSRRWVYAVYLLALNTGLRAGEIWGLKREDILQKNCLIIDRQWVESQNVFSSPKSKKSRMVPCNDHLKRELDDLYCIDGSSKKTNTIFYNMRGAPFNHANFVHRFFKTDMRDSKVRRIRFHDLRHTALTLMVSNGIDLRTVQEIAGHSDIKTTIQYVHLLGENVKKVSSQFSINAD